MAKTPTGQTLYEAFGTTSSTGWGQYLNGVGQFTNGTTYQHNTISTSISSSTNDPSIYSSIHYNVWENQQGQTIHIPKKLLKTVWAMAKINGSEIQRGMVQLKSVFQRFVTRNNGCRFIFQFMDGTPIEFDIAGKDMIDLVPFYVPAMAFVMQVDFKRLLDA